MTSIREEPFFNLKAVVQQTGLKPDTLRAWERRYGLPAPERSEGGHRLYSRRDIDTIKWLIARQREGLSISRAVDLWQQLREGGQDPLQASMPLAVQAPAAPPPAYLGEQVAELREGWIGACLAYDERQAEQILAQAFALYSPELVGVEILQKAVATIGEGWYRGDVTVQQEHFCSSLAVRHLEALVMGAPPPTRPGRILVACPPDEDHVIGLLLLTFLLRRRGWEVIYLGANVPADRLETTVRVTQPHLAILAAQQLHSAATLLEMARVLLREEVPLAFGGLVFNLLPELRQRIPGHFLGERLDLAPQVVERLMTAPLPQPETLALPAEYARALEQFRAQQSLIEADLVRALEENGIASRHLALANRELALNIGAALALGDMEYLGTDVEWIEGLIDNRNLPVEALYDYLQTYRRVAAMHLAEGGAPVVGWLDQLLDKRRGEENG
jgi:DNA-binding transcriptional MerR regulator